MNEKERKLLQENLEMLRKLFGWSSQQLANRLGINKQTVLNLEHQVADMTQIQYIAIRAIFEAELELRDGEEKQNINTIMSIIFNPDLDISNETRQEALLTAKNVSESNTKKGEKEKVSKNLAIGLGALGLGAVAFSLILANAKDDNSLKDRLIDFLSNR